MSICKTYILIHFSQQNSGDILQPTKIDFLFLEEFFDKEIKWANIDIAGTCWTDKNKGINPSGATGFGVKTLVQWIQNK